jgi:hypothetical protein
MQRILQKIKSITYLLLVFVINNRQQFKISSEVHNTNVPGIILTCTIQSLLLAYQTGAHYATIKVFNRLPVPIQQLSQYTKQFKTALKGAFYLHSFYSLNEYFKHIN